VANEADLVLYWFAKAHDALKLGLAKRIGFVATNSIRGGANRRVVDRILQDARIFEAWSDEAWVVDGAAVRVSLVCFGTSKEPRSLDGRTVSTINSDLTEHANDLTVAQRLVENANIAFMGDTKGGPFDIPGDLARQWLAAPLNPNGRSNSDVIRPWANGAEIAKRPRDFWIVDFGWTMPEREAALYEVPFRYAFERVRPKKILNRRESYRTRWWQHTEARQGFWKNLEGLRRYVATVRHSKFRAFKWFDTRVVPDSALIAIARDDDTAFGILHSRFHESWSLRLCTWIGVGNDPRYTPTTTFETFPFPEGLSPNIPAKDYAADPRAIAIAKAAEQLDRLRNAWLNPRDLIDKVPEVVPGYPDRILPKNDQAATELKKRTLTNLYNERPQWLAQAHRDLDAAVAAAYGWPTDIAEEAAIGELLNLNRARAGQGAPVQSDLLDDDGE
jgi:type II restriction/modification system DNA methylase subunit YeeA